MTEIARCARCQVTAPCNEKTVALGRRTVAMDLCSGCEEVVWQFVKALAAVGRPPGPVNRCSASARVSAHSRPRFLAARPSF